NDLDAVLLRRNDALAVRTQLRVVETQHDGDVGPVHVTVENADAAAAACQRQCQVHRHRRLANSALPRADRDDVLYAGHGWTARLRKSRRTYFRRQLNLHVGYAGHRTDRCDSLVSHLILHRTRRRGQLDRERRAAVGNRQVLHEAERHDVFLDVGIDDDAQRVEHGVAVYWSHILTILPVPRVPKREPQRAAGPRWSAGPRAHTRRGPSRMAARSGPP